jgi:hypothetical protein
VWRACFRRGFGSVVRQTAKWMNQCELDREGKSEILTFSLAVTSICRRLKRNAANYTRTTPTKFDPRSPEIHRYYSPEATLHWTSALWYWNIFENHIGRMMLLQSTEDLNCQLTAALPSRTSKRVGCFIATKCLQQSLPPRAASVVYLLACWPLVPKIAGSLPAKAIGFFGRKNPQHAFLRKGSKAVCPMSKNPIIYRGSRKL